VIPAVPPVGFASPLLATQPLPVELKVKSLYAAALVLDRSSLPPVSTPSVGSSTASPQRGKSPSAITVSEFMSSPRV